MIPADDDVTVICANWSRANARLQAGSLRFPCDGCRRGVTVSPQGQKLETPAGGTKRYLCFDCAKAESPDAHVGPIPGGLEAFSKATGTSPLAAIMLGAGIKALPLRDLPPEVFAADDEDET